MKQLVVAFVSGALFAVGLAVSGMTDPQKVDRIPGRDRGVGPEPGAGDGRRHRGARGRGSLGAARACAADRAAPSRFRRASGIDAPLVAGAALFGLGWGAPGFCPGPALVDVAAPTASVLALASARSMVGGSFACQGRGLRSPVKPHPPNRLSAAERGQGAWPRLRAEALTRG